MVARKREKFWKTFFEWAVHAFRIPNEMSDSKRGEILPGIPSRQSGDAAVALILPDLFADSKRFGIRNVNRLGGGSGCAMAN